MVLNIKHELEVVNEMKRLKQERAFGPEGRESFIYLFIYYSDKLFKLFRSLSFQATSKQQKQDISGQTVANVIKSIGIGSTN